MRNSLCVAILIASMLLGSETPCTGQIADAIVPTGAAQKNSIDSVARFASDDFVAGCLIRPAGLVDDPYFAILPIGLIVPGPISLERIARMGIEELVVFCGPDTANDDTQSQTSPVEWAAAARFATDVNLHKVIGQWHESVIPNEAGPDRSITAFVLDGHECYRVPDGSFFPPRRTFGTLSFIDSEGQAADLGVDVGNLYAHRSFIKGGSQAAAIFHLGGIRESDLIRDELIIELRTEVFWTLHAHEEFDVAWITVSKPGARLRSTPLGFRVASHANHQIALPRTLKYIDAHGIPQEADLLTEFVSDGQLEISIQTSSPGAYMGFAADDLNIKRESFEFVYVEGRDLVVARSPMILRKMLQTENVPVQLGTRLSASRADIAICVTVANERQRAVLQVLASGILGGEATTGSTRTLNSLRASLHCKGNTFLQIETEFDSEGDAEAAKSQLEQWISRRETELTSYIVESIPRVESMYNLLSVVFDGLSLRLQNAETTDQMARVLEVDRLVGSVRAASEYDLQGRKLFFQLPALRSYPSLSETAKAGLINLQEAIANDLRNRRRYDLFAEHYRRVPERFPNTPNAWVRCAHSFAFNTSVEFDGFESKYNWVRRGLNVLLDGLEHNPDDLRLTWMLAKFISFKIGQSDEHREFRRYFALDRELHKRLGTNIDIKMAKSPIFDVDSWLVASLLYDKCKTIAAATPNHSYIPPVLLHAMAEITQARYADELTTTGWCEEAVPVWNSVDRQLRDVGDQVLQINSGPIRLADLEEELGKSNPDVEKVELIRRVQSVMAYDYWLARASLETTRQLTEARKLAQQASKHRDLGEDQATFEMLTAAMNSLHQLNELRPTEFTLLAGEFRAIAEEYRECAKKVNNTDATQFGDILKLIEETEPYRPSDYINREQFGEGA